MTYEEATMWNILRKYFKQYRFRRQYSLGPYILDFYSPKHRIAIEIDGVQHFNNQEYDEARTSYIQQFGKFPIRIIRFWNKDVKTNLNGVVNHLMVNLGQTPPS